MKNGKKTKNTLGRGWWVQVYDDADEGKKQHYIPDEGFKTRCGLKFNAVKKRRKVDRCERCYKSTITKVYYEAV